MTGAGSEHRRDYAELLAARGAAVLVYDPRALASRHHGAISDIEPGFTG
ncbi:hypothetical protein [Nocardia neocaledoniensis]|nr:hypothetical protein [Nocardia neocaledoniensis]